MVFTTQFFTFIFLPVSLCGYFLIELLSRFKFLSKALLKIRAKDIITILFSLGFYAWTCFDNVYRLCAYILFIYLLSSVVGYIKSKGQYVFLNSNTGIKKFHLSKIPFAIALSVLTFFLVYYNYSDFLLELWNKLLGDTLSVKSIAAPLGLSFITFSAISYLTDVYTGAADRGGVLDCFLYITFFPKVISGPIVLYRDFKKQICERKCDIDKFVCGANKIMVGFAKKVILADTFGACLSKITLNSIDQMTSFGILVLYMLQIYYDFAGYSDIAIGISKLFGFDFKENFNFPYRSKSISEFWRRWHISLGSWFRQYIYFPLGGSRTNLKRNLFNLGVVFALTGIWHGAGWNYIIWGAINGSLVILERILRDKKAYIKTPNWVKYIATMLIVMAFWQLFKYQNMSDVADVFAIAFGLKKFDIIPYTWRYFYSTKTICLSIIGVLGATVLGSAKVKAVQEKIICTKIGCFVEEIALLALFIVSILFMINSTYSPFIYFQY